MDGHRKFIFTHAGSILVPEPNDKNINIHIQIVSCLNLPGVVLSMKLSLGSLSGAHIQCLFTRENSKKTLYHLTNVATNRLHLLDKESVS